MDGDGDNRDRRATVASALLPQKRAEEKTPASKEKWKPKNARLRALDAF